MTNLVTRLQEYAEAYSDGASSYDVDYPLVEDLQAAIAKINRLQAALKHCLDGMDAGHRVVRCFRCEEARALLADSSVEPPAGHQ